MRTTELIYFAGCPNVEEAREQLRRAFIAANLQPTWVEHQTSDPDFPAHARGYGSPTILVDGLDVTGIAPATSSEACRIYLDEDGRRVGAPPLQSIIAALTATRRHARG